MALINGEPCGYDESKRLRGPLERAQALLALCELTGEEDTLLESEIERALRCASTTLITQPEPGELAALLQDAYDRDLQDERDEDEWNARNNGGSP